MAQYEHLPIFKKMLNLSVFVENIVRYFSRYHKYTLGSELRIMCHKALSLIVEANSTRDRVEILLRLRLLLERIKIHLILAREVKAFNQKRSFLTAFPLILDKIPPHKILFKVGRGKGLPIGNLTSQFFANVYLNELDHYVKRQLRCKYYLRYCDDFILLSDDREQLLEWHEKLNDFITKRLLIELNLSQYKLRSVSSGIDFLGYITRRRYTLVRRRVDPVGPWCMNF
ncbi:MAG: reverse transcriptase domain-containing protein [Thermodesulfobacteriota bacterium]|nr:reverse transcriptase domain-containing protein [Thermodesulfobacteriota bacterium]